MAAHCDPDCLNPVHLRRKRNRRHAFTVEIKHDQGRFSFGLTAENDPG